MLVKYAQHDLQEDVVVHWPHEAIPTAPTTRSTVQRDTIRFADSKHSQCDLFRNRIWALSIPFNHLSWASFSKCRKLGEAEEPFATASILFWDHLHGVRC